MGLESDIELMIKELTEGYRNNEYCNLVTTNLIGTNQYIDSAIMYTISEFVKRGYDEDTVTRLAWSFGDELKKNYQSMDNKQ